MGAYVAAVSMQKLFAVLVALAVLFAPAFTRAGEAFAAVPDHHAQMMEAGHCHTPPSGSGGDDKAPAKSCCISMCMGIAITPTAPVNDGHLKPEPAVFAVPTLHLSYLGEIATPPPRRS
jgi:hypothetical protein